jgi:hypothetical protein
VSREETMLYLKENFKADVVEKLLGDPRINPIRAISYAVLNNQTHVVKRLLTDPRVDSEKTTTDIKYCSMDRNLEYAVVDNYIDIANLLMNDPRVIRRQMITVQYVLHIMGKYRNGATSL